MRPIRRPFFRSFVRGALAVMLVAPALAALTAAPARAGALEDALQKKSLAIAIPTDAAPYGFVGTDLQPQGLDIDIAKLIADKLGVKLELVPVSSANRIPYLQTGKVALVVSTLGKNPEREKVIDFSIAYSPFYQAVFGPKTVAVRGAADLAGKSVGVTRGAMEDQELGRIAPPGVDVKRYEDQNATIAAYSSGQVQLVALGASVAGNMMAKNPQLGTEYKLLLKDSPNYIGIAKGEDTLRAKVNEIIGKAREDGSIDRLCQKWLGRPMGNLPL